MRIIKKISERYYQFLNHPVTKNNELKAMYNYVSFNIKNRIFAELKYEWINKLQFIARKGDAGMVGNIYFGLYEFEESIFLLHFLEKNDNFLDVGANLGHYSLLLSGVKKCNSIAIEPVPKTFSQLKKQIDLNDLNTLISAQNVGVSNREDQLFFSNDRGTMNSIVNENYPNSTQVKVLNIDKIVKDSGKPIAMKIDVEGYEKFALEGAMETLQSEELKVVILELNQAGKKYGIEDDEIYELLINLGFKTYSYNFENRGLISLESYNKQKFNTIFVRDTEFVERRLQNAEKIKIRNKFF
ncbi:FkbM family methyltransferase [Flavobacterium sp.]|uniref:FkbM family methyltransferase n=1 Tax=Flavobacterium sp. TaxID=239 RepID=UPI0026281683|nr:FkbM family methyltransferase [Flavobacterium sp.]